MDAGGSNGPHTPLMEISAPTFCTLHVATVNKSTPIHCFIGHAFGMNEKFDEPLRTNHFGHVPPILAKVFNNLRDRFRRDGNDMLSATHGHVCSSYHGIRYAGMKS